MSPAPQTQVWRLPQWLLYSQSTWAWGGCSGVSQSLEPWSLAKFKVEPCGSAQCSASGVRSELFPPCHLLFLGPCPHQALADLLAECPGQLSPGFSFFLPSPRHLPSSPTCFPVL